MLVIFSKHNQLYFTIVEVLTTVGTAVEGGITVSTVVVGRVFLHTVARPPAAQHQIDTIKTIGPMTQKRKKKKMERPIINP